MELDELINAIDIVEYIGQYVELEESGDEWWGLSCFNEESTPSFSVREDPPVFYDYSSGIGGNVFTFIRYMNKCTAPQAIEIMRNYLSGQGISVTNGRKMTSTSVFKKFSRKKKTVKEDKGVILPKNYMDRYIYDKDKLLDWYSEGISFETMEFFGVKYDSFSNRIVYPIKNGVGDIVNVGGRTLDPDWKEKKLRKYTYFHPWGILDTVYGLYENLESIKDENEIILFEGVKSVMIAHTWGVKNTGAILTSHLNPHQMKILAHLSVNVVFALDKDVDITRDHNIQKLKRYVNVYYLKDTEDILDEKDAPVDKGEESYERLFDNRRWLA